MAKRTRLTEAERLSVTRTTACALYTDIPNNAYLMFDHKTADGKVEKIVGVHHKGSCSKVLDGSHAYVLSVQEPRPIAITSLPGDPQCNRKHGSLQMIVSNGYIKCLKCGETKPKGTVVACCTVECGASLCGFCGVNAIVDSPEIKKLKTAAADIMSRIAKCQEGVAKLDARNTSHLTRLQGAVVYLV